MLRAQQILTAQEALEQGTVHHTVTLDGDQRYRRRITLTADDGLEFLLDLPNAALLRHGDGLRLDDGRIVQVLAVPEELLEVRARDGHHMLQIAWHLGNRHLEVQIESERILIRRDHVIADMLHTLGAEVCEVVEPFTPEAGAYSHHHTGEHSHDH
ncbi:MAG: urease accessory protein UreE [Pseudomonadota bacterium]